MGGSGEARGPVPLPRKPPFPGSRANRVRRSGAHRVPGVLGGVIFGGRALGGEFEGGALVGLWGPWLGLVWGFTPFQGRRKDRFVAEDSGAAAGSSACSSVHAIQTNHNYVRMSIFSVLIKNISYVI